MQISPRFVIGDTVQYFDKDGMRLIPTTIEEVSVKVMGKPNEEPIVCISYMVSIGRTTDGIMEDLEAFLKDEQLIPILADEDVVFDSKEDFLLYVSEGFRKPRIIINDAKDIENIINGNVKVTCEQHKGDE